jgi:hypothetical protein
MTTKDSPLDLRKIVAGIVITVVGGALLKVTTDWVPTLLGAEETPTPTATLPPTPTPTEAPEPTPEPQASATPTPRFFDFSACLAPCNGANAQISYPDGVTIIHIRWNYAGVPFGAHYVRSWTVDGLEWVRYDCTWDGPSAGTDELSVFDASGLYSGAWQLTVTIDDVVVLQEDLIVEGDNTHWDPPGSFDSCYPR